ncbi:MAG: hypothetical protein ACK5HY_12445 [Parahaliea sp.]
MADTPMRRWFTLLRRELQECRVSLLWTPLLVALVLAVVLLASTLVAGRISAVGEAFMEVVTREDSLANMNISIEIGESVDGEEVSYRITRTDTAEDDDSWNFSRRWSFQPTPPPRQPDAAAFVDGQQYPFNVVLTLVNMLMMLLLLLVSVNYLLGSLYDDRRDRSILFWKSMPVSEWEVVLCKLLVALLVAPLIYLGVSLLAQVLCTLLSMLLAGAVWLRRHRWEI